jgi:hypothetical protein
VNALLIVAGELISSLMSLTESSLNPAHLASSL